MSSRYQDERAFKQAVEAHLQGESVRTGVPVNRLRKALFRERFLVRLALLAPEVLVKGGVALELRVPGVVQTSDLDLWMRAGDEPIALFEHMVSEPHGDEPIRFTISRVSSIELAGDQGEPGVRVRVTAALDNIREAFDVDVVSGEPFVGEPDDLLGSDLLAFAAIQRPRIRVFPIEAHIADKLHAFTRVRPRENSRVADLPHIALLAGIEAARLLEAATLRRAFTVTFAHYALQPVPSRVPDPPTGWTPKYAHMAYHARLPWPTLGELISAVRAFLNPVLAGVEGSWDPDAWCWQTR